MLAIWDARSAVTLSITGLLGPTEQVFGNCPSHFVRVFEIRPDGAGQARLRCFANVILKDFQSLVDHFHHRYVLCVPCLPRDDLSDEGTAEQVKIAYYIQNLVAHELVREP